MMKYTENYGSAPLSRDTVAAIMWAGPVMLSPAAQVNEAIERVRQAGLPQPGMNSCYVVAEDGVLLGALSLLDLLLNGGGIQVGTIMTLLRRYLLEAIDTMERDNVRLRFMGDMTPLSGELRELVDRCNAISDRLTGCLCSICINYGGRAEIVHGAQAFAKDCAAGAVKPEDLTEEMFENYLYSAGIPSPDLLIRPGGELRLSNFLLWQCAYTEIYVTDVLWPDFSKEELHRAIASYQRRDRRFGGVKR